MLYSQLLNDCQVKHLTLDGGGASGAVDMQDSQSVAFLVNFSAATGAIAFKVQESATTTASDFADVIVGYYNDGVLALNRDGAAVLSTSGTASRANQYLALSVNRPGRETAVSDVKATPTSKRYLRIVVTANAAGVDYALALKTTNTLTPVTQPDFAAPEVKGSN